MTFSRILPSLTSSVEPDLERREDLGMRQADAGRRRPRPVSRSKRNGAPSTSIAGPPAKVPQRSFGPCRSARMPIGRPTSASTWRISACRRAMSSWVPWLMFSRNTSAPATNRRADHLEGVGGGPERRDDLDVALSADRGHAAPPLSFCPAPVIANARAMEPQMPRRRRMPAGRSGIAGARRPILARDAQERGRPHDGVRGRSSEINPAGRSRILLLCDHATQHRARRGGRRRPRPAAGGDGAAHRLRHRRARRDARARARCSTRRRC